jgi:hypothetical protein
MSYSLYDQPLSKNLNCPAAGSGGFKIGHFDRKSATQVYELHREHTTAIVEGFYWARMGRRM